MTPEDESVHLDRLKKLAAELDAAQASASDTLKHVVSAKRQNDKLITQNTELIDTSKANPTKRRKRRTKHR